MILPHGGSTDEGELFEYTQEKAQIIESRLLKLLEAEDSPYERLIMRVPGFGRSATSYNTFIIIALLDEWKNREKRKPNCFKRSNRVR